MERSALHLSMFCHVTPQSIGVRDLQPVPSIAGGCIAGGCITGACTVVVLSPCIRITFEYIHSYGGEIASRADRYTHAR